MHILGKQNTTKGGKGFTLIEILVSIAIFSVLALGVLGTFAVLTNTVKSAREKTVLSTIASGGLEIVRNLSYSDVGTASGNPSGTLADYTNPIVITREAVQYRVYYEVTYIDDPADGTIGGSPNDPAPADYKQVKMSVLNTQTGQVTDFLTNVAPKGLEDTTSAGALKIRVFNFSGQPVSGANIHIEYPVTSPTLVLDRTTSASGEWIEVGLPAAVNDYRIVVTKAGYSTDRTYPITAQNPNPINPDATIVVGAVTEVSFAIDLLSNLTIRTLDTFCQNINGVELNVRGAKLIGTSPLVYKYNQDFTSSAGQVVLSDIEWDTYTPTLLTGQSWVVRGTSPIQKIDVLPGSSQTFTMILGTNSTANSLLVIVKDAVTGVALEGALVHLHKGGSIPQDYYGTSGGSVWVQSSWVGGAGYEAWSTTTPTRYSQDDGNVDINSAATGVRLAKSTGDYRPSGWLESSTFDTGTAASQFTTMSFEPTSQHPATQLRFQVASSNDPVGPWTYLGPDGTDATYYTVSGSNISSAHDNSRYVRYRVYLDTTDEKETPILTTIYLNYVSGCYTPGQVFFPDLTAGNNYSLDVTLAGYTTETIPSLDVNGHQSLEILLTPEP